MSRGKKKVTRKPVKQVYPFINMKTIEAVRKIMAGLGYNKLMEPIREGLGNSPEK